MHNAFGSAVCVGESGDEVGGWHQIHSAHSVLGRLRAMIPISLSSEFVLSTCVGAVSEIEGPRLVR